MSKIGLKLWNINTSSYINEAQELYKQGVYDYIELYMVPQNMDKLKIWKSINIPFNLHAPHFQHGMNLSKKENFESNLKIYEEVKEYADALNVEYIVFHSGTDGDYKETARQLEYIDDSRAVIENKPYKTLPFINGDFYVGGKVEEIKYVIENVGCRFCLDVGHAIASANCQNIEPYSYIKQFMEINPYMYHLSDIHTNSDMDEHLNYGQGNLDFEKLFNIISKNAQITIETNKKSKEKLDDFIYDVKYLKEFLE